VTAVALSADHTFVVGAYADGSIMSWDLAQFTSPAKDITPIRMQDLPSKHGHLVNTHINHISFIGTRHSLFLSADVSGMVFCHGFHRRQIVSHVESIRILGRYPTLPGAPRLKPSTNFAASVLPLGTVPHFTDALGLSAILTPYKLVIVSTTPMARTQFKMNRPTGAVAESQQIAASASWFPCVKSTDDPQRGTCPLLAVSWSHRLVILSITGGLPQEEPDPIIPIVVEEIGGFQCDEAIVALRWFAKDILCLLTASHQMLLLDTIEFKLVGQADLLGKHILSQDMRTNLLQEYFEEREAEYVNQTFAENYNGGFTAYKGKLFVLGHSDVSVGSVLTWKDRALAFSKQGLYFEALSLLEAYYEGSVESRVISLPTVNEERRRVVLELCNVLLREVVDHLRAGSLNQPISDTLQAVFDVALTIDGTAFLFDEVLEATESERETYLTILASAVLDDRIQHIPPEIVQELVSFYIDQGLHTRLEDVLCHLDAASLDTNQLTQLAKQQGLMDAFTHVWTHALEDFVTPLIEFIELIKSVLRATSATSDPSTRKQDLTRLGTNTVNAVKVYSYLSLTLTGRSFPRGILMPPAKADAARNAVYEFLFSGVTVAWPPGSSEWVLTNLEKPEPTFPYLRLLLHFDCPTFLACLDEAFEDPFLNEGPDDDRPRSAGVARTITRQFIINILLEVGSAQEDILALYMFIARNVPKYPQFILLSGSVLQRILIGLCDYQDAEMADDCQLAVESLLSVFRPAQLQDLAPKLEQARFFRVLKSYYRVEGNAVGLLSAYLQDTGHEEEVFSCIRELLGSSGRLDADALDRVKEAVVENIVGITSIDAEKTASSIDRCAPELHKRIIQALDGNEELLFRYLKQVMPFDHDHANSLPAWVEGSHILRIAQLLCRYDRSMILPFLEKPGVLDLVSADRLIEVLEQCGEFEGNVRLMSLNGQRPAALQRIQDYLSQLGIEVATRSDTINDAATLNANIVLIKRYVAMGANLCAEEIRATSSVASCETAETLWVSFLSSTLGLVQRLKRSLTPITHKRHVSKQIGALADLLCDTFGTLLLATSHRQVLDQHANLFVSIMRQFLERAAASADSATEGDEMQMLLREVFNAHALGGQLWLLAQQILHGALSRQFATQAEQRCRGWRVRRLHCCICERVVHPPILMRQTARAQQAAADAETQARRTARSEAVLLRHGLAVERKKGKLRENVSTVNQEMSPDDAHGADMTRILSHACGHVSHEYCVRQLQNDQLPILCALCQRRHKAEQASRQLQQQEQETSVIVAR
jgi:hypothetical protein